MTSQARIFYQLYADFCQKNCGDQELEARVKTWAKNLSGSGHNRLILSSELLTSWPDHYPEIWPLLWEPTTTAKPTSRPHPLPNFLKFLGNALGGAYVIRVLLTIRNQADYCASLYSQLWGRRTGLRGHGSQRDFARRLEWLGKYCEFALDWGELVFNLKTAVGEENVGVFIFEDGLEKVAQEMMEFIGDGQIQPRLPHLNVARQSRSWKFKKVGLLPRGRFLVLRSWILNRWPWINRSRLRFLVDSLQGLESRNRRFIFHSKIRLGRSTRRNFLKRFQASNHRLQQIIGRDLRGLGYY